MIQRIQTVYLFLALVALVCCHVMPIGYFEPQGMGVRLIMTNTLLVSNGEDLMISVLNSPVKIMLFQQPVLLAALLAVADILIVWTIFAFKNRKRQIRLTRWTQVCAILWYAAYFVYGFVWGVAGTEFQLAFAFAFPMIASVFLSLARHAIIKDEKLVRAADRIR